VLSLEVRGAVPGLPADGREETRGRRSDKRDVPR
jgi:hypothetical protein